jgi:hypothetical protein
MIRALVQLGGDVHALNANGQTPLFMAAYGGHEDAIRVLVELGGDVNSPNNTGQTPVYAAAGMGREDVIRVLVELGADIDVLAVVSDNMSALTVAVEYDNIEASTFLVNIGADLKSCLQTLALDEFKYIQQMVTQLWDSVALVNNTNESTEEENAKYALFSLIKLMSSLFLDDGGSDNSNEEIVADKLLFETTIARSMRDHIPNVVIVQMQGTGYVFKRRLVRIAWRVYHSSLLLDGDRVLASVRTRRYLEVVCLLFDLSMLGNVAALRMTCKSNNERRRFPVCFVTYQELEANMIEECVGYASSRFVSTDIIHAVMAIHNRYL